MECKRTGLPPEALYCPDCGMILTGYSENPLNKIYDKITIPKTLTSVQFSNPEDWYKKGEIYRNGNGVNVNYAEAFTWYLKAAEQGHDKSQFYVAYFYHFGNGVAQNYHEALRWYLKAADHNDDAALCNIGSMYHNGEGVEKNYDEAKKWYIKAIAHGSYQAKKNLAKITQSHNEHRFNTDNICVKCGMSRSYSEGFGRKMCDY
jgi:TPR repeat protein